MPDLSQYRLAFADEFNTLSLYNGTSGNWKTTNYWGNRNFQPLERQLYVDPTFKGLGLTPHTVSDGVMTITANKASDSLKPQLEGEDYTSGMIASEQTYSSQYGYFEMRAQLPAGTGLWPAFWLLPIDGGFPEIDIMEQIGQNPDVLHTTAHSKATGTHIQYNKATTVADTSTGFHTYGLDWGPDKLKWYFDGQLVFETATPADMHDPMYMIANLAVGGSWPGDPNSSTGFPAQMKIDYIRAYERPSDHAAVSIPTTWSPIATSAFSTLDGSGASTSWEHETTMGSGVAKLQMLGNFSRYATGNGLDNFIGGSAAQHNEIDGRGGNDVLRGNGGIDVFVVRNGDGNDTILDFSRTAGNQDKVELHGFHFKHFDDVKPWLKQVGSDTMLRLDQDQALLFKNVNVADLRADQFVFLDTVAAPSGSAPIGGGTTNPTPTPTPTTGTSTITLRVSGDHYQGAPQFNVSVDGVLVATNLVASAVHGDGQWVELKVTGSFAKAPKDVSVTYTNDLWGGSASADRNLYVDSITVNGTKFEGEKFGYNGADPTAAAMFSGGTLKFITDGAFPAPTPTPTDPIPAPVPSSGTGPTITGTDLQDFLSGTNLGEAILLKGGSDVLTAGGGNDTITGGSGKDWMSGQAGNDRYVYNAISETRVGSERDVICDWGYGADRIDLGAIDARTNLSGNQAFTFIGANAFSGRAGELRTYFDGKNTIVMGTVNADKTADFHIEVSGRNTLSAGDFVL
jgi:beta-glucanase (GH16 family)